MAHRRRISSRHACPRRGTRGIGTLLALRCQPPGRWTSRRPTEEFWSYKAYAISTDIYSRFLSFFSGDAWAFDDEVPASVLRNGQRPVMMAVGRRCGATGRGHDIAF
jgi:hypothetical protein